jgi:hypothetical protein
MSAQPVRIVTAFHTESACANRCYMTHFTPVENLVRAKGAVLIKMHFSIPENFPAAEMTRAILKPATVYYFLNNS